MGRTAAAIAVANTINAASGWIVFLAIARLESLDVAGEYSIIVAVATPVFFFFISGIRPQRFSDARAEVDSLDDWLARGIGGALGVFVCAAWFGLGLSAGVGALIATGAIAARLIDAIAEAPYTFYQKARRVRPLLISTTIRSLVLIAAAIVPLATSHRGVGAGLLAGAVLSFGVLIVYDAPRALRRGAGTGRWSFRHALAIFAAGLPLGIAAVLVSLTLNLPRIALGTSRGDAAAGRFAAMTFLFAAVSLVTTAASHTSIPVMARALAEGGRHRFLRTLRDLLLLGLVLGVAAVGVAATIGPSLLGALYGSSFSSERVAFAVMALALAVSCIATFLQDGLTALGVHRMQVVIFGSGAVVVLGTSLSLIPALGTRGAAIAVLAATSVQLVFCAVVLIRSLRRAFPVTGASYRPDPAPG